MMTIVLMDINTCNAHQDQNECQGSGHVEPMTTALMSISSVVDISNIDAAAAAATANHCADCDDAENSVDRSATNIGLYQCMC